MFEILKKGQRLKNLKYVVYNFLQNSHFWQQFYFLQRKNLFRFQISLPADIHNIWFGILFLHFV